MSTLSLQAIMIACAIVVVGGCMSPKLPPVPAQNPQTDFATTRTFDAPPERIWEAWTNGEYLQRWWGPRGFTCPVAEMDVRVDGTSLVAMQAPPEFGGMRYYNTWTYSIVAPPHRLDFVSRYSDERGNAIHPSEQGLPSGIPAEVPHVLIFEPINDGGTRLTIIEYGYESDEAINLSRRGLEQCLDKLAEILDP